MGNQYFPLNVFGQVTKGFRLISNKNSTNMTLLCLKLGQCDLYIQFHRLKFNFPIYFHGNNICLQFKGFVKQVLFNMLNIISMTFSHINHLTLIDFGRSRQPFLSHHAFNTELCDPWVSRFLLLSFCKPTATNVSKVSFYLCIDVNNSTLKYVNFLMVYLAVFSFDLYN